MRRFSEFSTETGPLEGDKIRLDDVCNIEISITGYTIRESKYKKNESGKYLTLQIELDGECRVIFTGSDVLIGQAERYANEMPFVTTIKKINRYYTFT